MFILVAVIWPLFFSIFSVYDGRRLPTLQTELLYVFLAIIVSTLTLAGTLYFSYRETPRLLILIFFFLDVGLLLGVRLLWSAYRHLAKAPGLPASRTLLIIGAGPVGQDAARQLMKYAWQEISLCGYLDDDARKIGQQFNSIPVLGTLDQASNIVQAHHVHDAIVALPLRAHKRLVSICEELQKLGVRVNVIPDLFSLSFPDATLDGFGGIPVIDLGLPGIHGWRRIVKRAFDVVSVACGLLLLSPFLGLIALIIKLDSKGPVIYRQPRIGERGQMFTMFKFRSMRADADPDVHKAYVAKLIRENTSLNDNLADSKSSLKMEDDPRITRFGKFIRKTSIDELPQLFNVLRGDMSLVGPRPPLPYEVDLYKDWHKRRLEVPPGITGLWQIKGRNVVSFDEMVRMDLEYIKKQSLWLDLKILLMTPLAVFQGKGVG